MDELVDELMNSLHKHKLAHCMNVMVVSDHGVAPVTCTDNFFLEAFTHDIDNLTHVYTGAVGRLRAKEGGKYSELRCSQRH